MPPKNKPKTDSGKVGVYDVELMTEEELRQYIEALKEESERLKTAFIGHQTHKREIEDLMKSTQEDILNRYETLMQKEIKLQQLLSESSNRLKDEYKKQLIENFETNRGASQNVVDNFTEVHDVCMIRQEELKNLQKELNEREKDVDTINLVNKFVSIDMNEQREEEWSGMMEKREISLEEIATEFYKKYSEKKRELFEEQDNLMSDILNSVFGKDSDTYPTTNETEKMSCYFKDLFWKNIKAKAKLELKVDGLEKELKKLTMLLKNAERENTELLKSIGNKTLTLESDELAVKQTEDFDEKELDYLTYENFTLHEKLRQVTEERNVLRAKFISEMRKVYRKADFKNYLTEQMIVASLLNNGQRPQEILLNDYLEEDDQYPISEESNINSEYDETETEDNQSSRTL